MYPKITSILLVVGCALALATSYPSSTQAQTQTVGLFVSDPASAGGYTLFAPIGSTETYLLDIHGRVVNTWPGSDQPGLSVYLLENGDLLRTVNAGGVQRIAWDGTVLWDFAFNGADWGQHHDVAYLPNGNVLLVAKERKSQADALQAGRDPTLLKSIGLNTEYLIEVEPSGPATGDIVWEWHLWDHLVQAYDDTKDNFGVVTDHPELVNINYDEDDKPEWVHFNSVAYNPDLDQIVMSAKNFNEFWVIDHSTNTEEAASHLGGVRGRGGDIIYRWGNPAGYDRGGLEDQKLFEQHDADWIDAGLPGEGNILVYNNGLGRPEGEYSTIEEITPAIDGEGNYSAPAAGTAFGPVEASWTYIADPPAELYSSRISGAQRLPNGNTLICEGRSGHFFEITPDQTLVWDYYSPLSLGVAVAQGEVPTNPGVFRSYRYMADYPGLIGRDLTPGGFIETYELSIVGSQFSPATPTVVDDVLVTAIITAGVQIGAAELWVDVGSGLSAQPMYDDGTHGDVVASDDIFSAIIPAQVEATEVAYYIYAEDNEPISVTDPPNGPLTTYRYTVVAEESSCCIDRVGDANTQGGDEPTIGDISVMIDAKFIAGNCDGILACLTEADINQSGGIGATCQDVTIGDISLLIDYLFITGISVGLAGCL